MSLRGTWHTIKQTVPKPAWVRFPGQQRFCFCCSIRTGAAVVGWFNFVVNSLYVGMLLVTIKIIRDVAWELEKEDRSLNKDGDFGSGDGEVHTIDTSLITGADPRVEAHSPDSMEEVIQFTLPIMLKSISIPAIMIVFSILWVITVEASNLFYVRLFGRAFIFSIVIQLIAQLAFLIYVEVRVQEAFKLSLSYISWIVYVVYALLNIYFIPILNEYIRRRIRECAQGMEQGLLTSEMYPRARIAEEYIQDAFTVEPDTDMVQFEASLVRSASETSNGDTQELKRKDSNEDSDTESPI